MKITFTVIKKKKKKNSVNRSRTSGASLASSLFANKFDLNRYKKIFFEQGMQILNLF